MAEERQENTQGNEDSDFQRVQDFIKEQVQTYLAEETATRTRQQQQQTNTQDPHKELREYLAPVTGPEYHRLAVDNADTRDMLSVVNDPMYAEFKEDVDKIFTTLKEQGRPIPRKDILNHVMGREYNINPDRFAERTGKVKKAQLARAQDAVDLGSGAIGRLSGAEAELASLVQSGAFAKLPSEEQAKHLEGVVF